MADMQHAEILVHITAPSLAVDDTHYRSLASAYLSFQPTRYTALPESLVPDSAAQPGRSQDAKDLSSINTNVQRDASASHDGLEHLGPSASVQLSFEGALDNAHSPQLRRNPDSAAQPGWSDVPDSQGRQSNDSSWRSPSSVINDSFADAPVASKAYSTPTRVLEHYLQQFASPSQKSSLDATEHTGANSVRGTSESQRTQPASPSIASSSQQQQEPRIIPATPDDRIEVVSSTADPRHAKQPGTSSSEIIEETILIPAPGGSFLARSDSEPPLRSMHDNAAVASRSPALVRTISDIGPEALQLIHPASSFTTSSSILNSHKHDDSLEVRGPEPSVSVLQIEPHDMVTPSLARLANQLDTTKRFRPRRQSRNLRPLERGYWLLDCSSMDPQLKLSTWQYLATYIAAGKAGWGVSCTRDATHTWVRVYCWGIVVPHTYLLMYLATLRNILNIGCRWIDGAGEVVVTMGVRK